MMNKAHSRLNVIFPVLALCFGIIFMANNQALSRYPRFSTEEKLDVSLPVIVLTWLSGGERDLAAFSEMFRVLTLSSEVTDPASLDTMLKIQKNITYLNPYLADNYYLAASILAWQNRVEGANQILQSATQYRTWDPWPPFYLGFNQAYFQRDFKHAIQNTLLASNRATDINKLAFKVVASKWASFSDDFDNARMMLNALHAQTSDLKLKRLFEARMQRLDNLELLHNAVKTFVSQRNRLPHNLQELVDTKIISRIPVDPFGKPYALLNHGDIGIGHSE